MKLLVLGREAYAYTGGKPFDPALPCVVFIHGALHDHSVFALQTRYLAHHGHAVLAVDLPGHGRSAGPALDSVEALADWLVALLDAAGVTRAALVGHSMGSLVALEAAARLGERATHLALVATAYPMKVSPALLETSLKDPHKAMRMVNSFSISTMAAKPSAPGPGTWLHGGNLALMQQLQARHARQHAGANLFHIDFSICDRYAAGLEAARRIRCPALLLLGAQDQMTPPAATKELAAALRARVQTLRAGHSLMTENPDGVLNALKGFLSSPGIPS
ncbi:MAG: alpha/beta fold hydrolase [Caldimonas sp.]|uniref:alpha/beta fold hydrolase n=1 Tax=Caldimonas sp. TaxID=2838790 RepID=UPI00391B1696